MTASTWGVLHPGAMGASVAANLARADQLVLWCDQGRSDATRRRAADAGASSVADLATLVERCDGIVSVCPPGAAEAVAEAVASEGFTGIYLDANAIAPATSRAVAARLEPGGARVVDGGIVGPPAWTAGSTRLFVSGPAADAVDRALQGSLLDVIEVEGGIGAASAVKVAYATWTKAVGATLLAVRAYAAAEGVTEPLLAEWDRSQPGTADRSALTAAAVGPKAWRFGAEMRQLAMAMEDVGLPGGFHEAAAVVYDRMAALRDAESVSLEQVLTLLQSSGDDDAARE